MSQDSITREHAASLIRRHSRWILARADADLDFEDLLQEVLHRLETSKRGFNPAKGSFRQFASVVIRRAIGMLCRRLMAKKRNATFQNDYTLNELADPTVEHERESTDLELDVAALLKRLPSDLRAVAEQLKFLTVAETANELGVSTTTVRRRIKDLLKRSEDAGWRKYL